MLFDRRRVVGLLSPKAIFILAWGNAPGLGVRIPGAMPLAMLIMAVGQSERFAGVMPVAMGDYGRWPIGTCSRGDAPGYGDNGRWPIGTYSRGDARGYGDYGRWPIATYSRGDAPGYGDYGRWPIGVPVICELSDNGNGSKLF